MGVGIGIADPQDFTLQATKRVCVAAPTEVVEHRTMGRGEAESPGVLTKQAAEDRPKDPACFPKCLLLAVPSPFVGQRYLTCSGSYHFRMHMTLSE